MPRLESPDLPDRKSHLSLLVVILALLTCVRLAGLTLSVVDLFDDEAQYWSWSRDLAFGYYTKPPLLAWLLGLTSHVCGDAEWCVRSPAPILYFATSLTVYFAARNFYDERTGFWAALLTALTTGIVFSARIMSTDVPLLFFWTLALLAYSHLLRKADKTWAVVLGVSIGLGLLSKYAMIYFIPGMFLAALASPSARNLLKTSAVWLAMAIAAIVVAPNLIWNAQNGFATFHHTGNLVLGEQFKPSIVRILDFILSQFGVFGPVVFATMIIATSKLGSTDLKEEDRVMVAFFITPLVLITLVSSVVHAYANWASVSAISGLILTAALLLRQGRLFWLRASIVLGVAMQGMLLATDAVATRLSLPFVQRNPYRHTIGLHDYANRIGDLATSLGAAGVVIDDRGKFAVLRYYLRDRPFQILSWGTVDNPSFDTAHPLTQSAPQPLLFVSSCGTASRLHTYFSDVKALGAFDDFSAFLIRGPEGPIGILRRCGGA